ncbi:hypothetical protein B0J17DRAFT_326726 [Rhizoctonia solani]|nr:hypothetical protein B0J17DRAFT_326726 [Rhizoctonia solani]
MGTQELFTVVLELHGGAGLPRAAWHGVGRAPFDRNFVSTNNLVCLTCARDLVAAGLLAWGQSIRICLSPSRPLCEFGIACRQALVDEGHAQAFSHICTPTGNHHPRRLRDDTGAQEDGNRVVCDHTELGDQGRYSFPFDTGEVEFKRDGKASFLCSAVVHSELQGHIQTSTYPGSTVIKQGEAIAVYLEGDRERAHPGSIRLLLDRRNMQWVRTSRGQIPPGCRPVLGGVDRSNNWEIQELYHCAAWLGGVRIPGYIPRGMKYAHIAHPLDGELWKVSDDYELLCWT